MATSLVHTKFFSSWLWIFLSLLSSVALAKPPVVEISLEEMVLLALSHNPDIYGQRLDQIVQKYHLASAYAAFQPRYFLNSSANYTYMTSAGEKNHSQNLTITPKATLKTLLGSSIELELHNSLGPTYYNPKLSLSITQPLLKGFGYDINAFSLLDAQDQMKIAKLTLKRMLMETITTIIKEYHNIVRSYNNLNIQKLTLANRKKELANIQLEIKAGQKPPLAVLEIEASIASQELQIAQAENALQQAKVSLLEKVGVEPNLPYTVVKTITVKNVALPPLDRLVELALANNTDYQISWLQMLKAERTLQQIKNNQLWQLDVTANASTGGGTGGGKNAGLESLINGNHYSASIGFNLSIPLDTINQKKDLIEATVNLEKQRLHLAQKKRELISQTMNKIKDIQFKEKQIELAQRDRDLKKQLLDNKLLQQKHGLVTLFEVESERNSLIQAEQNLINEKISYLDAIAELEQLVGITLDTWQILVET